MTEKHQIRLAAAIIGVSTGIVISTAVNSPSPARSVMLVIVLAAYVAFTIYTFKSP